MLFIYGDIVMRILSKRQLKELVLYSPQHIARLEKAGTFPKRVQIGPNRVGWVFGAQVTGIVHLAFFKSIS